MPFYRDPNITYPAKLGYRLDVLIRRDTILRTLYHHETHNPDSPGLTARQAFRGRITTSDKANTMRELVRYGFVSITGTADPSPKYTRGRLRLFRLTDLGRDYCERVDPTTFRLREEPCATATSGTAPSPSPSS